MKMKIYESLFINLVICHKDSSINSNCDSVGSVVSHSAGLL